MNFQSNYLKTVFGIIGINDVHLIAIDGASLDTEKLKDSIAASHQRIKHLIEWELV